ncbi:hypothetical protein R9C00_02215 [Flammeovirgaceae bacterium SG7u.111]|nr:hypothetical protein [Flammeovirgaceae bacterium SG7u.132]WPO36257.1 hypothetical protein R9C00_02215 [Flammeovirgaceae bacterium SG7u.111]
MEQTLMAIGFLLAAYSVVGNDVIQTLGTFLSSNSKQKWWVLWLFAGSILTVVLVYGWLNYNGDVSYARLSKVNLPVPFHWWYVLPPLVLMVITRFGVPVSTTFLILSVFSSSTVIGKMITKSVIGYLLAFAVAIVIYFIIARFVEKWFIDNKMNTGKKYWTVLQWLSTGFLWSQWLIQDLANIYVFLPRPLPVEYLVASLAAILGLLAYIFYNRGGSIQKIITTKTNTADIRSATIVDFIYGFILLFFKQMSNIPMSTTWVFVGLLAGREFALTFRLAHRESKGMYIMVLKDLGKVLLGLVVSTILVVLIKQLES